MAENESGQEKTEQPSERRRQDSRKKGNVAKSQEVNSSVIVLVGTGFLFLAGGHILSNMMHIMVEFLSNLTTTSISASEFPLFFSNVMLQMARTIGPLFLTMFIMAIVVNVSQVGLLWAPEAISPKFEKLNLIKGFKRLVSMRLLVDLLKNMLKLTIIGAVIYITLSSKYESVFLLADDTVGHILTFLMQVSGEVLLKVAVVLLFLAVADYAYQRWEYEKNLKMTKEELKEENKMTEGNPQIKARIKEIQRASSRRRMMTDVPEADVVITNPTHFAVALKYDPGNQVAPVILAKGKRKVALRIKEIAKAHNIPTVEDPPLARLLFRNGEVGKEIPVDAYQAVAEVLGYIYRMQNKKFDLN